MRNPLNLLYLLHFATYAYKFSTLKSVEGGHTKWL